MSAASHFAEGETEAQGRWEGSNLPKVPPECDPGALPGSPHLPNAPAVPPCSLATA